MSRLRNGAIMHQIFRLITRLAYVLLDAFLYLPLIPILIGIRIIKPWLIIRFGVLNSLRIGHFSANTELYLCEKVSGISKRSTIKSIDIFCLMRGPVCNNYLTVMWRRVLNIWPSLIILPLYRLNQIIPYGRDHTVPPNSQNDRDIHNLFEKFTTKLEFTDEEVNRGQLGLIRLGVPPGKEFICLNVRDSAYLDNQFKGGNFSYHDYRDSKIEDYVLAAEELANRGFYVIRMGAKVHDRMPTSHPMIIDYAGYKLRDEFMDIYLAANCYFAISTQSGWDCLPYIFRKPICYVNVQPIGYFMTFERDTLLLAKKILCKKSNSPIGINETFKSGMGFLLENNSFKNNDFELCGNSPQEIRDTCIEMLERISGTWRDNKNDEILQNQFWDIYKKHVASKNLHGTIHAKFSSTYLRNNKEWLI